MAETPRHGDIVEDTENVLRTVFVYSNEKKNCLQPLDIFPLQHCTEAWKFSSFGQNLEFWSSFWKTFLLFLRSITSREKSYLKIFGWVGLLLSIALLSLLLHISTISLELISRTNDNASCLPSFKQSWWKISSSMCYLFIKSTHKFCRQIIKF